MPASLVATVRRMPFDSLVTVTLALATAAPLGSRTVPETLPKPAPDCANTPSAHTNSRRSNVIRIDPLSGPSRRLRQRLEETAPLLSRLGLTRYPIQTYCGRAPHNPSRD